MNRREVFAGASLGVVLLLAAATVAWTGVRLRAARSALDAAVARRAQWESRRPAPVPEAESRLAAELAEARQELALQVQLWRAVPRTADRLDAAAGSLDAVVRFARFVQDKRREVRASGVRTRSDEAFGFALPSARSLDPVQLPALEIDRVVVDRLVTHLLAAGPAEILGVRRGARPGGAGSSGDRDGFAAAGGLSLRRLGWAEVRSYQLEFLGTSTVLGRLLPALAAEDLPVMVTSVSAEAPPLAAVRSGDAAARRLVRFVVELECIAAPEQTEFQHENAQSG